MNNKYFVLLLCAGLACTPADARRKKKKKEDKKEVVAPAPKPAVDRNGLFHVTKVGTDWFFQIPDSLIGRRFLTTTRFTATPANSGKFGGEQLNEQVVYWELGQDGQLLLRADLLVNKADSTEAIYRAITISNANPIIGSFKVEEHKNGARKIKVTSFFNEDNPSLGMTANMKRSYSLTTQINNLSFIEDIKSFPMNTEVRLVKTWNASGNGLPATSATGRATFGLNISFVLLPEKPMMRRYFDPRVGYFADRFNNFSDEQQRVHTKTFITRWRLEPRPEDVEKMRRGELVEPQKPIVYYIDPATPKQWRKYLIAGVNDWQKAFEKAGFKNAIIGKEWPENDSTMSLEDARFSVIRYLASPIENAYGPNVHDPRSGEIIESHICWYHNVMSLVHDWYMVQVGSIDEAARKMKFDEELMGQLIRFVSSHEVGHTLGLRHNFGASSTVPVDSLRNRDWLERYGHTPSIMDYARFNYVAQPEDRVTRAGIFPRINDYDLWAIQWGYTPMLDAKDEDEDHQMLEQLVQKNLPGNPRLWFGDGETNRVNDPRCQTEDLGDDAMKAGEYGILNLKRMLAALPEWTYEADDINNQNLQDMYGQVRNQFNRYVFHVLRNIGGYYNDFKTVDEQGPRYTPVEKERQVRALDFLDRHILNEPTWLLPDYMNRFTSKEQNYTVSLGTNVLRQMLGLMGGLNPEYPIGEYLPDLTKRVFTQADLRGRLTDYRRAMQGTYVATLISSLERSGADSTTRPYVLAALQQLKTQTATGARTGGDVPTRAHYASLNDLIVRALTVK